MDNWDSYRPIVIGLVVAIILPGLHWVVNRNSEYARECKMGFAVTMIYFLGALLFSTIAFFAFFDNPPSDGVNDEIWLKPLTLCMAGASIGFALDAPFRRFEWNDEHLVISRLFRRKRFVSWADVTALKEHAFFGFYTVGFADGSRAAFGEVMKGSRTFIAMIQANLGEQELE